jgi:hypothetical protein
MRCRVRWLPGRQVTAEMQGRLTEALADLGPVGLQRVQQQGKVE